MISLKNLFSISLLTMCCTFAASHAQPNCPDRTRCPSKKDLICRTAAAEQSANLVNSFTTDLYTAINETDPVVQANLVQALLADLTTPFSLVFNGGTPITNGAELLAFVQGVHATFPFITNLSGNFTITDYGRDSCCKRTLQIETLNYIIATNALLPPTSVITPATRTITVVESSCNVFQIQSIALTTLTEIDVCCFAP